VVIEPLLSTICPIPKWKEKKMHEESLARSRIFNIMHDVADLATEAGVSPREIVSLLEKSIINLVEKNPQEFTIKKIYKQHYSRSSRRWAS
jgi:hypothetical protein